MMMRLQKFMAHAGLCSRRKAEAYILEGRVKVNGTAIRVLGTKIDPQKDEVRFDNQPVLLPERPQDIYIALHKPAGVISSCARQKGKIVLDLVKTGQRIYPVGRLDKESTGLLLMTNDGRLHHRLSHPSFNHEKEYIVTTQHPVKDADLMQMSKGMRIDGTKTRPARVSRLDKSSFKIILKQGLNRQIRKMVGKTGNQVTTLKRIRIAHIRLGNLKEGSWRHLSQDEVKTLFQ